jgi:hypothetical protein
VFFAGLSPSFVFIGYHGQYSAYCLAREILICYIFWQAWRALKDVTNNQDVFFFIKKEREKKLNSSLGRTS